MNDIEVRNIINSLNNSLENLHVSFIYGVGNVYAVSEETIKNIINLLKKQEAKQVINIDDFTEGMEVGYCPSCNRSIVNIKIDGTKFCKFCGQAVKWE